VQSHYSLGYYSKSASKILNAGLHYFRDAPAAEHVADIYSRISGVGPLLREDFLKLPSLSVFSSTIKMPIILEVVGGDFPSSAQKLIEGSKYGFESSLPKLESVLNVLKRNSIHVDHQIIHAEESSPHAVSEWLRKQSQPVFIIHRADTATLPAPRLLMASNHSTSNSTESAPLDERQISQYQICLWTGLVLVLLLLASVCSIVQMEVVPDSLLYAKFQSGRTGGKFE